MPAYHCRMSPLTLFPFEPDQLSLVEPWFHDGETQRWLGGPGWPRLVLDRAGRPWGEYRGRVEMGSYRWLAWEGHSAVGYIDCGVTDRFTEWDGDHGILDVIPTPSGNISYVVDPRRRRRGYAVAMLNALWSPPQLSLVRLMVAGVEPANVASVRALLKAGYQPLHADPDWEGVAYHARLRTNRTPPG